MKVKQLLVLTAACLAVAMTRAKDFSLDLRAPKTVTNGRAMRAGSSVLPAFAGSGALRKVDLAVGASDVGAVNVGDKLSLTLFDDVKVDLVLKQRMPSPLGGDVFLAEVSGYEGLQNAVVLRTAERLTVDIQDYRNRKVYKVISTEAGVTVQEVEAKGGTCGCDALTPPVVTGTASPKASVLDDVVSNSGDKTCVDILVAYDQNAATWAIANGGGVTNFAQMAVQKMNTVLANNGLDAYFRFRLVGVARVADWSDNLEYTLQDVLLGNGEWASVQDARDEVGADIVSVLIDTGSEVGTTGLGCSLKTTDFGSFADSAYNVCAIRSVAQSHTMTHEVGHNMGCGHSNVQSTSPGPQLYSYSSGYYFAVGGEKYHTVMAYGTEGPGGIEVPFFSSPFSTYKGVTVGDDNHNNSLTLYCTYEVASKWRAEKGSEIGGDVPLEPLEWLTTRDAAFAKARAEGKKVFLISGRDTCGNTMGTRDYSCEDPSVKRHLLKNYVCWYNNCDDQYEESAPYFNGYDMGNMLPFIAIIDVVNDKSLAAEGGYHSVNDLRGLLGRIAQEVVFSPEAGTRFHDSIAVTLSAAPGAAIYYTLDGSDPSSGVSTYYDKPITLTLTTTIRAATFAEGAWGLPAEATFAKARMGSSSGYEWAADEVEGGCIISSVTPVPTGAVSMPAEIDGLNVVGFAGNLFRGNAGITGVSLPPGVTEIPDEAFRGCSALRYVEVPDGVKRIGQRAFSQSAVETVFIPEGVVSIGDYAFTKCEGLSLVVIPSSVTRLGYCAFDYCTNLKGAWLPAHLRYGDMQYDSFWACDEALSLHYYSGATTPVTVEFDANGGTLAYPKRRYACLENRILAAVWPTPEKPGDMFLGWFTAVSGGEKATSETVVVGNVTFYARWRIGGNISAIGGGFADLAFAKMQTVTGALYKNGTLVGTVQVKAGKINMAKRTVKLSATATLLEGGKAKKVAAKAVNVVVDATGRIAPTTFGFRVPIGNMTFEMAAGGTFTLTGGAYAMANATVGGALRGGSRGTFVLGNFGLTVPGELQDDLLPYAETFDVVGNRWTFAKAATVKWGKNNTTGETGRVVDVSNGKTNRSALKLTYTAKTGIFKGFFKAYALVAANGKKKVVKYTVNVIGIVVDGNGQGEASCKRPVGGPWVVMVE